MCGRFTQSTPAAKLIEIFSVMRMPELQPRYNVAPTQTVLCIRESAGKRQADMLRWGLVPSWAKDLAIGNRMINARSETAAEKPSFRRAWKSRRCLIPTDGFYEWEKLGGQKKQPWFIHASDHEPFALAGLWESWKAKPDANSDGEAESTIVETFTILTTAANEDISEIHDRMPVIIPPESHATWLSESASLGQLQTLTKPSPTRTLNRYKISDFVNKPVNDSLKCVAPV